MGNLILVFAAAVVFLGVFSAGSLFYWGIQAKQASRKLELARRLGTVRESDIDDPLFRAQSTDPLVTQLGKLGTRLEAMLYQAGSEDSVRDVLFRAGLFSFVGVVCTSFIFDGLLAWSGLAMFGVPVYGLHSQARARARLLTSQLPDGLDLVARTLRAGHGLSDSIRVVAEEMPSPLAEEFSRVYREHHLGRDMRVCLSLMAARNPDSFDLRLFVTSVQLQRQTGGNLVEVLENMARTVRERFVFHAKVSSLTAEVRFSATILSLLPMVVGLAVLVLRPGYLLPLIETSLGQTMLLGASTMFGCGLLIMRHIAQVRL